VLKVALIGCGKMAEQHAASIRRIRGCELVAVCDREPLMVEQLRDHFNVHAAFEDAGELLRTARPDVVHITTPPRSHYDLALLCLRAGCHIFVEKPFTIDAGEAEELLSLAESAGLRVTVGHNAQFSHAALKFRRMIREGYLGGRPVHLESIFCYDLGGAAFAQVFLGDRKHWVRRLPGKLLQNIISHGIGQIVEYLEGEAVEVVASGFTSRFLRSLGEEEIIDELRVMIRDEGETTAYFTFSSQLKPKVHQFRVFGEKNGLVLDDDHQVVIALRDGSLRGPLNQFVPPLRFAGQYVRGAAGNLWKFLRAEAHGDARTKLLIEQFYRSIAGEADLPIAYRDILMTARIMDEVFRQVARSPDRPAEVAFP
jgi:predicted dehydrogenase